MDVDYFNENIGWIECEHELLLTADGGNNWIKVYSTNYEDETISDAFFFNDTLGWVISDNYLFKTVNGGIDWMIQSSNTANFLQVLNDSLIYLLGNNLYKSINGGKDWQKILTSSRTPKSLAFLNENYGYVLNEFSSASEIRSEINKTTDGGITWERIGSNTWEGSKTIEFVNDSLGFLLGNHGTSYWSYSLYRTADSGNTWSKILGNATSFTTFPQNHVYVSLDNYEPDLRYESHQSTIVKSIDNGDTWDELHKSKGLILEIEINENQALHIIEGFAIIGRTAQTGVFGNILSVKDYNSSANNWNTIKISQDLQKIHIVDRNSWLMSGSEGGFHWSWGNLIMTRDGGSSFQTIGYGRGNVNAIDFGNNSVGYFSAYGLNKTLDGGISWENISPDVYFDQISFINPDTGWGLWGNEIYNTQDGGLNWKNVYEYEKHTLRDMDFIGYEGWSVGRTTESPISGIIIKYDPTEGWRQISSIPNSPLGRIRFIDREIGFVMGGYFDEDNPKSWIHKTEDGGYNWKEIFNSEHYNNYFISDMEFNSDGTGWLIGKSIYYEGVLLTTYDFGESWFIEIDDLKYPLNSISLSDSIGYAVGDEGLMINLIKPKSKIASGVSLEISDKYFDPKIDTINFIAEISNPENHQVEVFANIYNADGSINDTVFLYNDLEQKDNISNNNIWSGSLFAGDLNEDMFEVELITKDIALNYLHTYPCKQYFTTVGPVYLVSFKDTLLNNEYLGLHEFTLYNSSKDRMVEDISIHMYSVSECLGRTYNYNVSFGDIYPKQPRLHLGFHITIELANCEDSLKFLMDIASEGRIYWKDSLSLKIPDPTGISILDLPEEFSTEQNYPNPFNPSTTIRYTIPHRPRQLIGDGVNIEKINETSDFSLMNVKLKIYDILGSEVATLVNEKQKPGYYKVEWDASNYASGIYLYRFQCGDFIKTRKMIFLK
jgi:photosystem II stability/assembly factor-like uncharacterized protein